ncbi:undecaprenyl diphosphate synthase [Hathewaya proteolytica DSM 3090]|uniref:Isoprenyl transferase n=1 Tax=Hathewaya proteolytica DSM 3090 TaxID=1121331 RepID=A0A1M6J6S4_9CLOT|nr:isoprenyl transferase [Hathewaya proteolytica]SHJ42355.1 undecaprenyl diphosphate synthase [Hathewaya proteolytica DSM 3090]
MGIFLNLIKNKSRAYNKHHIDMNNIPKHIAIIMDGNGRWAQKRKLPRTVGHKAGVETIRNIVKECSALGVSYLTLYAFSTENWKRPQDEVSTLMNLLVIYLKNELSELHNNNVRINYIGDINALPIQCINELIKAKENTKDNTGLTLTLALNYGARSEMLRAVKNICIEFKEGNTKISDIDENYFSYHLYTKDLPDPDLLIRTSGEERLSNFLLWQLSYTEFWFTNILWPDFTREDLRQAIISVQNRDRRYGGLK